jgi:hypothetical protein
MFISYLVSGIAATDTTIEVPDGSILPQNQVFDIYIEQETLACTSFASANVINVQRGHAGTEAVAHDAETLIALDEGYKQPVRTAKALDTHIDDTDPHTMYLLADGSRELTDDMLVTAGKLIDGRDLSVDGAKLDGIEAAADVTDATNVDAAGAVMNADTSVAAMSFKIDEDDMASDSDTKFPTQQSVKKYVDDNAGGVGSYVIVSDTVYLSADTERSTTSISYVKVKEIRVAYNGVYRVKFDLKSSLDYIACYGRIYKNGVAVGTEQTNVSLSYITYSEDLVFTPGDLVQLYYYHTSGTAYTRNFRLCGTFTSDNSVTLD